MGLLAWAHVALFITITSGFDVYTDDNIHDVVKNGWLNYRSSNNLPKCCSDNNCKMVRLSSTLYKKVNQKGDQLRFSLRDGDDKMGAILSYSHQKGISGTVFFKKERKAYFLETIPEHEANDQSSPCYKSRYARSRYLFYRMKFIKSTDGKIPKQFLSANSAKAESPCCWGFMCKGVTGVDTGTLRADKNGALPDLYVPRGNQPASDLSEVFTMTATQPRKCRPTCTVYFYHNNRNEMLTISKSGSDSWSLHLEAEDGKDLRLKKCVDGQFLTQSRAASGKTLIPMRPAAKPKPSGSSKKASGKLSGGPKLPAGGYGMKKEKPTNTNFHEIDVSMQRVAPGEQCWYPNYICNQLKHVKRWFYLDATDPTKDDEDWIMDCYESFAECGGDCTHFTYSNYGGRPECTLHDGCDAVYNSKCFELGKCRSGPGDCEPLMANKNCTSAPDLGPDYSTWQCMDRMGKKLGPVQPNAPLPSATFCIIGCDSWLDTASTPANPIQGILSSRCQNDGTWSATTPLNGAPTLTYPLPPYPLPTAGVGESPSPLSCACPDLTLTLDGQIYDPNAEEAASFTCFSKNTFDPVTGFKIQANDVCILLCDGNHALTIMCSDQGWTNSPELGIWCYEKPATSNQLRSKCKLEGEACTENVNVCCPGLTCGKVPGNKAGGTCILPTTVNTASSMGKPNIEPGFEGYKSSCITTSGPVSNASCMFPFIYKQVAYSSCTNKDRDRLWCATQTDRLHYVEGNWGYCGNEKECTLTCPTTPGSGKADADCVFPFTYNGKTYDHCTYVDSNRHWCSTKTDSNGDHVEGEWAYCNYCRCPSEIQSYGPDGQCEAGTEWIIDCHCSLLQLQSPCNLLTLGSSLGPRCA